MTVETGIKMHNNEPIKKRRYSHHNYLHAKPLNNSSIRMWLKRTKSQNSYNAILVRLKEALITNSARTSQISVKLWRVMHHHKTQLADSLLKAVAS
jgi:metal-dependent HD superfamily phosphatase/phosphodiesterase